MSACMQRKDINSNETMQKYVSITSLLVNQFFYALPKQTKYSEKLVNFLMLEKKLEIACQCETESIASTYFQHLSHLKGLSEAPEFHSFLKTSNLDPFDNKGSFRDYFLQITKSYLKTKEEYLAATKPIITQFTSWATANSVNITELDDLQQRQQATREQMLGDLPHRLSEINHNYFNQLSLLGCIIKHPQFNYFIAEKIPNHAAIYVEEVPRQYFLRLCHDLKSSLEQATQFTPS